mmetsp:Transcript_17687/g.45720  ORF Transcript_17687/g.45720 Transcript_17687/m.45720 type:complete len:246 (+) Transcript_17687:1568-2305(+)
MPPVVDPDAKIARLRECTAEFKLDKFWADLAKPVDRAIAAIKTGARAEAEFQLRAALTQLPPADNSVGLFAAQRQTIGEVLAELGAQAAAPAAADPTLASETTIAAEPPAGPPTVRFEQDASEVTVSVTGVPAATKTSDVRVKFGRTSLRVSLAKPADSELLAGELAHPVRVDGCSWAIEGAGAKRAIVITLEKASGGLTWPALLADGTKASAEQARRAHELNELVAGALADTGLGSSLQPLQQH